MNTAMREALQRDFRMTIDEFRGVPLD